MKKLIFIVAIIVIVIVAFNIGTWFVILGIYLVKFLIGLGIATLIGVIGYLIYLFKFKKKI